MPVDMNLSTENPPATGEVSRPLIRPLLGVLGVAMIIGCAASVHYKYSSAKRDAQAELEKRSTLFVNPFDATEVFELEPGLTEDQARQVVGQLLIERAKQREGGARGLEL